MAHATVHDVAVTRPLPVYSVIVPAYNEAAFLPLTLQSISSAMRTLTQPGEMIVVDNNSTDDTAEVARSLGAHVVFEPINQISRARNAGAAAARGKFFIFIDADTEVSVEVLGQALDKLTAAAVCGGGATVAMNHPHWFPVCVLACWNFFSGITRLAAGCFLFCRRDAFEACGGFSEKVYASEELWLSMALARWGRRRGLGFIILRESVSTSARKVDWLSAGAITRQVLIFLLFPLAVRSKRFCGAWYVRPGKDAD
ncbi:MAG: glycosyltransferase [Gammaproteobacteria bacterium]